MRLPRYGFEESPKFMAKYEVPSQENGHADDRGSSDRNPISLDDRNSSATVDHFLSEVETFLRVLYPRSDMDSLSSAEWIKVLAIANRWGFDRIKEKAIRASAAYVTSMGPITKASIAQQMDVPVWAFQAYAELACRPSPVSADEAKTVGFEIAYKISLVRERIAGTPESSSANRTQEFLKETLAEVFDVQRTMMRGSTGWVRSQGFLGQSDPSVTRAVLIQDGKSSQQGRKNKSPDFVAGDVFGCQKIRSTSESLACYQRIRRRLSEGQQARAPSRRVIELQPCSSGKIRQRANSVLSTP